MQSHAANTPWGSSRVGRHHNPLSFARAHLVEVRGGGEELPRTDSPPRQPSHDTPDQERTRQFKLTRSYSHSAVVPTAAAPDHLEQEAHSGDLDLLIRTSRMRKDKTIVISISSAFLGRTVREKGGCAVLHWGVQIGDDENWHRPPKAMLPAGTQYRCHSFCFR